jgi:hypothetical protein
VKKNDALGRGTVPSPVSEELLARGNLRIDVILRAWRFVPRPDFDTHEHSGQRIEV